jgi:pseudaminic acid synthase
MAETAGPDPVVIGGRPVGPGEPPYVIAELSANHGGSLDAALAVVRHAAAAGAHAVKLQTYTPDTMTLDLRQPPFLVGEGTLWAGRTLYDLYEEAQTPWEWHEPIFALAAELGLACFSSPFDATAVEFLERFDPPAHKIASFELLDVALIRAAAATGRPHVMSTGMATVEEVDDAVEAAREGGAAGIVLLRCNSAYPSDPGEMDLLTIPDMVERWGVPVGLSDHTHGSTAAVVACGLGAVAVEKHLIARRSDGGPDATFSAEPEELAELVTEVAAAARIRGGVRYGPSTAERSSLAFRRSLYVVADVAEGEEITAAHVRAIRPGGGLAPKHLPEVVGRRAARPLARGTALTWEALA